MFSHAVLGNAPVPALINKPAHGQPRQAWREAKSPYMDSIPTGKPPLPPTSRMSDLDTHRTGMSKKSEQLTEEWYLKVIS